MSIFILDQIKTNTTLGFLFTERLLSKFLDNNTNLITDGGCLV